MTIKEKTDLFVRGRMYRYSNSVISISTRIMQLASVGIDNPASIQILFIVFRKGRFFQRIECLSGLGYFNGNAAKEHGYC